MLNKEKCKIDSEGRRGSTTGAQEEREGGEV